MLLVEDGRRLPRLLLAAAKRGERDVVVVARDGGRPIQHAHAPLHQAISDLDVFPGRVRKARIEEAHLEQELAWQGDVRCVEEVERHRFGIVDQAVAELKAVFVDVVQKGRDLQVERPGRVAENRDGMRPLLGMRPPRARTTAPARERCRRRERARSSPGPLARRDCAPRPAPRFPARRTGRDRQADRPPAAAASRPPSRRPPPRPRTAADPSARARASRTAKERFGPPKRRDDDGDAHAPPRRSPSAPSEPGAARSRRRERRSPMTTDRRPDRSARAAAGTSRRSRHPPVAGAPARHAAFPRAPRDGGGAKEGPQVSDRQGIVDGDPRGELFGTPSSRRRSDGAGGGVRVSCQLRGSGISRGQHWPPASRNVMRTAGMSWRKCSRSRFL